MRSTLWLATAVVLGVAVGCDNQITRSDIDEQRQEVAEQQERVDELRQQEMQEDNQVARDNTLRDDTMRDDVVSDDTQADLREAEEKLRQEREQLAAMEERQKVEADMQRKLDEMDRKIDKLEERAAKAEGEEKIDIERQVAEFQTRHELLQKRLDELRAASGDTWSQLKTSLQGMSEDVSNQINTAVEDDDAT